MDRVPTVVGRALYMNEVGKNDVPILLLSLSQISQAGLELTPRANDMSVKSLALEASGFEHTGMNGQPANVVFAEIPRAKPKTWLISVLLSWIGPVTS